MALTTRTHDGGVGRAILFCTGVLVVERCERVAGRCQPT